MDELSLVEASQAGDRSAFAALVDRYYRSIYRVAYQYTGSHHDADDICQEAFLRAFDNIGSLRDGASFRGWIFTITSNLLRKRVSRMKLERKAAGKSARNSPNESAENEQVEPSAELSASEKTAAVRSQLQQMPEQMRLPTILVLMEGLSQKNAAGILSCSEASVCRRLEMARQWLGTRLKDLM